MKTPFKIRFSKEYINTSNEVIINEFKQKCEKSFCDKIEVLNENKVIVRNSFFKIRPNWNWNIWNGVGYAELTINEICENEKKKVNYLIDFTQLSITTIVLLSIFSLFIFLITPKFETVNNTEVVLFFLIPVFILPHLMLIIRHINFFYRKYQNENLGNYNWEKIFENKTIHELTQITH